MESFTLAADELHLTQSAISHQVRGLEDYFARPLFIRRNRRVELTLEGKRLLESLSKVFDTIQAACNEVALAPQAEVLAVHSAPSFAAKWLGPRLPDFNRSHPDVTIRLTSGADLLDLARAREIDVAISYGAVMERAGMLSVGLGTERIVPLCSPDLIKGDLPVHQILGNLVLIDSQLSSVTWHKWFALNNLVLPERPRPSFDRAALAISAAVDGTGVALESIRLAEREISRGELVELGAGIFKPLAQETHFVSCRTDERQLKKVRLFREWLFKAAGVVAPALEANSHPPARL